MTYWGPYNNHLRVGLDWWWDNYDTWTPSINVYVQVTVQCEPGWNFGDNESVSLWGDASFGGATIRVGPNGFRNNLGSGATMVVASGVFGSQGQSYGGGPTYTVGAQIQGNYLGGTSNVSVNFDLPPRPIRAPSPPYPPATNYVTATTAGVVWGAPNDTGGAALDYSWLQVARQNFYDLVTDWQQPGWAGRNLTGLAPNTTYWARAAAHTAGGWGGWSGISSFATSSYQMPAPTASGLTSAAVTMGLTAPNDPAAPASFHLQWSRDGNFSTLAGETSQGWATSYRATGLAPATRYYFRARGNPQPGTGWGAWSGTTSIVTSSFQPPVPALTNVEPDKVRVSFTVPPDPTVPTQYNLQWSKDPTFASISTGGEVTAAWTDSYLVTGLTPGTPYSYRVRANNGNGWGTWSGTPTSTTLTGARIKVNGQWVNGIAHLRKSGAWVPVKVNKRTGGAWVY